MYSKENIEQSISSSRNSSSRSCSSDPMLDWRERVFIEDIFIEDISVEGVFVKGASVEEGSAVEEGTNGAGSDKVAGVNSPEAAVDNYNGLLKTCSIKGSGT